jgi:hypothetical protein
VALVAVVVAMVGWLWVRPWWQARELTHALEDIPGVASVDPESDDRSVAEHPYVLKLDDDVTAVQLGKAVRAVDRVLGQHHISGDRADVQVRAAGFVIGHSARYPLPAEVGRAVVALREVEGLTGVEADDSEVTVSVGSEADLLPIGQEALRALAGPEADTTTSRDRTRLRIVVKNGGPFITAQLADVEGQLRLLSQLTDAAEAAGALAARGEDTSSSISLYGATADEGATCSALLRVGPEVDLGTASRTLVRSGPGCITLMAEDGPTLDLRGSRPDPAQALALRRQLQTVGADLRRANTSLSSVEVTVDSADSLQGLIQLTRDEAAWAAPENASVRVIWRDGRWAVFEGDDISLLQDNGTMLVGISRAGFRAYVDDDSDGPTVIGVSDDTEGAPDLTTDDGRGALVAVLRGVGFDDRVRFSVEVDDQPYPLSFTSTSEGEAEDVQEPEKADGLWAVRLLEAWNATAG